MTVIELAHIVLKQGITGLDPALKQSLLKVKQVIEDYSHLPTNFFAEKEDPSILYVIGSWESTEKHSKGFSGSPAQHEILGLVKDQMDIDWMHYMDVEYPRIPTSAPILTITRYMFKDSSGGERGKEEQRQEFRHAFSEPQDRPLENAVNESDLKQSVGGWNLPKNGEDVVLWVQFAGWSSMEDAAIFRKSRGYKRVEAMMQDLSVETDVKHVTLMEL